MDIQLSQGTYTVEGESSCRYLGAIMDRHLHCNGYTNYLDGKATEKLAVLAVIGGLTSLVRSMNE